MSKCLIIGDIHLPVVRPGYLDFCKKIRDKYKTDTTIFIGDVIDWHAISFHEKEPMCPNTGDEYEQALAALAPWKKTFPTAIITLGNHDCRPERLAKTVAIPETFLKSYNDLWGTPKWSWVQDITIDDVYYYHGTGRSGIHPAWNVGHQMSMSVVMGHCHSRAGVKWWASPTTRYFAMDVGCGIDVKAWQFTYGQACRERPVLACGAVLDGTPYHEIMPLEKYPKEKYHDKRFKKG